MAISIFLYLFMLFLALTVYFQIRRYTPFRWPLDFFIILLYAYAYALIFFNFTFRWYPISKKYPIRIRCILLFLNTVSSLFLLLFVKLFPIYPGF